MTDDFVPERELPLAGAGNSSLRTASELPTRPASSKPRRQIRAKKVDTDAEQQAGPPRQRATETKAHTVLRRLRATKGVTVTALIEATGWQAHSVRGFLSGTVKKKLGLCLVSEVGKDGIRRYRIAAAGPAS